MPRKQMIERGLVSRILAYMLRQDTEQCIGLWFGKTEQIDREIRRLFLADVEKASHGEYDHWIQDPDALIALVILLDQFRRNIYRGTRGMYALDDKCLAIAHWAISRGIHTKISPPKAAFLHLALCHSEDPFDQRICVTYWQQVMEMVPLSRGTPRQTHMGMMEEMAFCARLKRTFIKHEVVISSYGRFPHRNVILGRASSEAEIDFLNNYDYRFDLPYSSDPTNIKALHA